MPVSVQLIAVHERNGRLYVEFDDREIIEFESLEQCRDLHADLVSEVGAIKDAKRMLIARGLNAIGTPGHNLQSMVGRTATFARAQVAGNMMRIT
ncbi:MAG: hypothetical protein ACKO0Z_17435 [Betaproteobacteria bacterium]